MRAHLQPATPPFLHSILKIRGGTVAYHSRIMICNHLGLLLVISSLLYNEASGVCTERESPKANLFFKCSLEIEDFTFDSRKLESMQK